MCSLVHSFEGDPVCNITNKTIDFIYRPATTALLIQELILMAVVMLLRNLITLTGMVHGSFLGLCF